MKRGLREGGIVKEAVLLKRGELIREWEIIR